MMPDESDCGVIWPQDVSERDKWRNEMFWRCMTSITWEGPSIGSSGAWCDFFCLVTFSFTLKERLDHGVIIWLSLRAGIGASVIARPPVVKLILLRAFGGQLRGSLLCSSSWGVVGFTFWGRISSFCCSEHCTWSCIYWCNLWWNQWTYSFYEKMTRCWTLSWL